MERDAASAERTNASHIRLKVKIYPEHALTSTEVANTCRRLREFCDESLGPLLFCSTVDLMEGFGMGHADG